MLFDDVLSTQHVIFSLGSTCTLQELHEEHYADAKFPVTKKNQGRRARKYLSPLPKQCEICGREEMVGTCGLSIMCWSAGSLSILAIVYGSQVVPRLHKDRSRLRDTRICSQPLQTIEIGDGSSSRDSRALHASIITPRLQRR